MGYNSPITIMQNQIKMELENGIYKAVQKVDIEVDKDELIKALSYDREQYDKGYKDGRKETVREILQKLQKHLCYNEYIGSRGYFITLKECEELAKQYGVEVESE